MNQDSDKIRQLLDDLTLKEKISFLGGNASFDVKDREGDVHGVKRVGIPALKFADGPVGVHWWTEASTCYPANIALAATFSEQMAEKYGAALGTDCRAVGIHVLLAPGVNLYRSPLCGRNFEYLGEDPELAGLLASAYIRGVQSKNVAATVKHLAVNNQEYDRHGISSDVDERTLREVYLRPFELAVTEGDTACVMTAYGLLNGQYCSENQWLIDEVLREDWAFDDGFVMSDWTSVHSSIQTLNSGLDIEMPWAKFLTEEKVQAALASGTVTLERITAAVRHRLVLMERFGWLENAHQQQDESLPARNLETEAVALETARQGIVLLKNDESLLPAAPDQVSKIVVLGYHANAPIHCGGGSANTKPHESINLLKAIRQVYGSEVEVHYHTCLQPWRGTEAFESSKFTTSDGQQGLEASYFNNTRAEGVPIFEEVVPSFHIFHGESRPDTSIDALLFSGTFEGRLEIEHSGATDFYMSSEDAYLTIEVGDNLIFERVRGPRRVTLDLPKGNYAVRIRMEQTQTGYLGYHFGFEASSAAYLDYDKGLAAARNADLVIVATGFVAETEGEAHDRDFELDSRATKLITDVAEIAPGKTCVVLYIGGAVQVEPWFDRVSAVINLWYPGQNGTLAAAEILAGRTNPSGKLPFTWEKRAEDRGSYEWYHDEDQDNRVAYGDGILIGYRWFDQHKIEPQFPFGYGMSYTTFAFENLHLDQTVTRGCEPVSLSFEVVNMGGIAGAETGLVFVGEVSPNHLRPPKELKAFRRVFLEPGERKKINMELPARAFAFWNPNIRGWMVNPGQYMISVARDAMSEQLNQKVSVLSV